MAKDDYDVIAYKILLYFYACKKRKIIFDERVFKETACKNVESNEYLIDIIAMMQDEGLIKGAVFQNAWGHVKLLISDLQDIEITVDGIHYLKENSRSKKIKDGLIEAADIMADLIRIVRL